MWDGCNKIFNVCCLIIREKRKDGIFKTGIMNSRIIWNGLWRRVKRYVVYVMNKGFDYKRRDYKMCVGIIQFIKKRLGEFGYIGESGGRLQLWF